MSTLQRIQQNGWELLSPSSSDYYLDEATVKAKNIQSDFELDEVLQPIYKALSYYWAMDSKFESEGYGKLQKGLYIIGEVGVGKTLLMKAFSDYRLKYEDYRYGEVVEAVEKRYEVVSTLKVTNNWINSGSEEMLKYCTKGNNFCFDDLGTESIAVYHKGNKKNVFEEIILHRYEGATTFRNTHFTSNLDAAQVEEIYGKRVRSRLREMTNFIIIPGTDRRK